MQIVIAQHGHRVAKLICLWHWTVTGCSFLKGWQAATPCRLQPPCDCCSKHWISSAAKHSPASPGSPSRQALGW